jgi:hypothetical protein
LGIVGGGGGGSGGFSCLCFAGGEVFDLFISGDERVGFFAGSVDCRLQPTVATANPIAAAKAKIVLVEGRMSLLLV